MFFDRFIHSRTIAIILSCALFLSFGLHAIQIEHTHGGGHTPHHHLPEKNLLVLGEYMHGSDKKLFSLVTMVAILVWGFLDIAQSIWLRLHSMYIRQSLSFSERNKERYRFLEYLERLLRRGILHSKAH